ncbi:MAG: CRISPR-associated ring nuclease Crn3/Csx3 [Candidatus Pacearchaeota archaeon]
MNFVKYDIGVEGITTPTSPLPEIPLIKKGSLVVLTGRAPIWRYCMALHRLHGSPAGAVAVYDPRLGAVVVQSHHLDYQEGQIININI